MKSKLLLFSFLLLAAQGIAKTKTITVIVEGDKNGPTTVNPNGTVSVDCDVSYNTCARVKFIIEEEASSPSVGDPTNIVTEDGEWSGGFVSENTVNYDNSFTYELTLSDLE